MVHELLIIYMIVFLVEILKLLSIQKSGKNLGEIGDYIELLSYQRRFNKVNLFSIKIKDGV